MGESIVDRMLAALFDDPRPDDAISAENVRLRRHISKLESKLERKRKRIGELKGNTVSFDDYKHLRCAHDRLRERMRSLRLERRALILELERMRKCCRISQGE